MIYINIGSNLSSTSGDRFYNLKKSVDLFNIKNIKILKISRIYETPSYPNKMNPKFLNICLALESKEKPESLIKIFNAVEKKLQRKRGFKNHYVLVGISQDVVFMAYQTQQVFWCEIT
mgnify:CR=1 FL=1